MQAIEARPGLAGNRPGPERRVLLSLTNGILRLRKRQRHLDHPPKVLILWVGGLAPVLLQEKRQIERAAETELPVAGSTS